MLIILSPSKTQDFTTPPPTDKSTQPRLLKHAEELATEIQKLPPRKIAEMMSVSTKIADKTYDSYQSFSTPFTSKNAKPAIFAFQGDVYRDIDVENYTTKQLDFAQEHVRTISGLYGLLRPLDLIQPYRLEMKYRTDYWRTPITEAMQQDLAAEGSGHLINLASNEYSKPIDFKSLKATIITPVFKEKKPDGFKTIALYSKIARGTMTNFVVKNMLTKPEQLKDFTDDGYKFSPKMSSEHEFVFTRSR